jgi:hypothetical protein
MVILSIPRAADGNRTHDLFLTKEVLYQLSYSSVTRPRAGDGIRTHDILLGRQELYR